MLWDSKCDYIPLKKVKKSQQTETRKKYTKPEKDVYKKL